MSQLSNTHKQFIVKQLACFEKPSEVVELLKEEFGVEVTRQQVSYYNPESSQGRRELAAKWRHLFSETRDRFIQGTIDVPIAHKSWRVKELQKIYSKLLDMGNLAEAKATIEQAAREMGGAYEHFADKIAADGEGSINFYQQVNNRIVQLNRK